MAKLKEYAPTSYLNFDNPGMAARQRQAIAKVQKQFAREYPLVIDGRKIFTDEKLPSINPANTAQVIGSFSLASQSQAEQAIQAAARAFQKWRQVSPRIRAHYLLDAAEVIRSRRMEINAWMISEVGKNYLEADADTCEAIDFLEFYAREMIRYASPHPLVHVPGEHNKLEYIPLGVGAVIPPWNFPFAILVGTASAAIVTGNTVVLKPSSDSPMMGWLFCDIMRTVGLPKGVLNFLPGNGSEIGDHIVDHPLTRFISFTGSASVGRRIYERASRTPDDQLWLKRVVAEMGGKDAIIVDSEADLESAADGVVAAAFSFQGQKCSACSRAIVDARVYNKFIGMVRDRVGRIELGEPTENKQMGPVVSARAYKSIRDYIKIGRKEGRLIAGGGTGSEAGYYIEPTVFADIKPDDRLAQEEIFGPVLAIIRARNFDDALKIANGTKYGLTGAVYTRNEDKLERAANEFHVGNLYLNRKCTGALVGVHPFGGFNLSGTDSKAGGRDYLLLFLQAKSIARKVDVKKTRVATKKKPAAKKAVARKRR